MIISLLAMLNFVLLASAGYGEIRSRLVNNDINASLSCVPVAAQSVTETISMGVLPRIRNTRNVNVTFVFGKQWRSNLASVDVAYVFDDDCTSPSTEEILPPSSIAQRNFMTSHLSRKFDRTCTSTQADASE